jgi:hypothetical protein
MKRIVQDLHSRGLAVTASNLEREFHPEDIDVEKIKGNKHRIVAFANKLSMQPEPSLRANAKVLMNLVDSVCG